MSTSESYDTTKLLTNLNITNWDHHLLEKLSAYPIMGKAIRKGIRYKVIKPTVDDLFEDGARMYSYLPHSTNQDKESRKDFLSACTDAMTRKPRSVPSSPPLSPKKQRCYYGPIRPMSLLPTTTIPSQCILLPKLLTPE